MQEASEKRKPVITVEYDLIPEFAGEKIELSEEDIIKIINNSLGFENGMLFQEAVFVPRVNVIVLTYDEGKRSRVIFVTKESQMMEDFGTLTLDNLDNFSFDNFTIKELRHEDYDIASGGLEALVQIKVKNSEDKKKKKKKK